VICNESKYVCLYVCSMKYEVCSMYIGLICVNICMYNSIKPNCSHIIDVLAPYVSIF
jgi:hypothetical protein